MYTFFAINIAYIIVAIFDPYFTSRFIDGVILNSKTQIIVYALIMFGTWLIEQVLGYIYDIIKGKAETSVWKNIIRKSDRNLLYYNSATEKCEVEDVEQHLGQNYELIKEFTTYYPVELLGKFLQEIGITIALFIISPMNAVLAITFIPFFVYISARYSEKMADYGEKTVDAMANCRNRLVDLRKITLSERLRTHSRIKSGDSFLDEYEKCRLKQVRTEAVFSNFLSYAFLNLLIVVSLIISGIEVYRGKQTIGELYAIQLYVSQFWTPIEFFIDCFKEYSGKKNIINEFNKFLNLKTVNYSYSNIKSIQLKDYVTLDSDENELHEPITCEFNAGNIYWIVGENGVGKTSLALAIMGMSNRFHGTIEYSNYGENRAFTYSIANPISSSYFNDNIAVTASMGQLKMAQLLCDFAEEKDVYIMDEPTNYLDKDNKIIVHKLLKEKADTGSMVIVISHDAELIPKDGIVLKLQRKKEGTDLGSNVSS